MSIAELMKVQDKFKPYADFGKMNVFHNKESGQVIVIIFNPNIIGLTKFKDIITLNPEELQNVILYFKTRDVEKLEQVLSLFKQKKDVQKLHELREN